MADRLTTHSPTPPKSTSESNVGAWDEMTTPDGKTRPIWKQLGRKIQQWSPTERESISAAASRMIADLGTTFNVYSDVGGVGQPYKLDAIPLMVQAAEWKQISAGLTQRMRIINAVLADIYGPQELLRAGLLPPDLIHSSPEFLQFSRGIQPAGGRHVITTGCDLVRQPNGQWTVLRDHTSALGGLGQVLENRHVTANLLSEEFDALEITRLGNFFEVEFRTLRSLLPSRSKGPNVVFLTPGFRHPSYFEHAYKARLLGFPLVEAADLTVRERRLFLKTLAGLRRIESVVSLIPENRIDPLENSVRGGGGIPGIMEAWRSGNVALANAPGAGFAASPALMPFLPGICRKWLGEEIILPFVETWWLGQPEVRRQVIEQLHRYILLPASGSSKLPPIRCADLSQGERKQWTETLKEHPHDFVAQLEISPSRSPSLEGEEIHHQPVIWRAFTLNADGGPIALPGGLARVGNPSVPPQLWQQHAGFTKDVWIPKTHGEPTSTNKIKTNRELNDQRPTALEVPSRIAEQLFWVGRYAERIELATRLLRVTLRNFGGEAGRVQQEQLAACFTLIRGSNLIAKDAVITPAQTASTLTNLIHDHATRNSIANLTRSLLQNAAAARDRLSDDTWRFFNRIEGIIHPPHWIASPSDLLRTLDTLVLHLAAFSGMQAENMTRGHGWRFLEIGRRIERALSGIKLLKTTATQADENVILLELLLETCDSVMTYRRRHFSRPRFDAVTDLIFSDPTNPRSVAYQIGVILQESTRFPGDSDSGLLPKIRQHLETLHAQISNPTSVGENDFHDVFIALEAFADMLTQHYFSHSVRRVY
ncbi:MAG: circularly permuted type 2 ATP-grasp protein [Akkermansiaceae bacterium]|nr:circularly permuted type 2 ATP-grasp protein [Akkermansiaceae bacterium]